MTAVAPSIHAHRQLPWRLRGQLRRLGTHSRANAQSSGIKEWSDRELARLQPWWIKAFLRRHLVRCIVLACLYLFAFALLAASFERYWHWLQTTEAVAGEPVTKVDRWTAFCRVKPWTRACRPVSQAAHRQVTLMLASSTDGVSAVSRGRQAIAQRQSFPLAASTQPSSSLR